MPEELTTEEVALLIKARKLINAKGLPKNIDVSGICETAGISRKTGYQWADRLDQQKNREAQLEEELFQLKTAHEKLKQDYEDASFEVRGRKLAWEIHRVDELIKKKKEAITKRKKKERR